MALVCSWNTPSTSCAGRGPTAPCGRASFDRVPHCRVSHHGPRTLMSPGLKRPIMLSASARCRHSRPRCPPRCRCRHRPGARCDGWTDAGCRGRSDGSTRHRSGIAGKWPGSGIRREARGLPGRPPPQAAGSGAVREARHDGLDDRAGALQMIFFRIDDEICSNTITTTRITRMMAAA